MTFCPKAAFITGGGSGIGRALAEAFHKRGVQVVIAGRRIEVLQEVCAANKGMHHCHLDVTDPQSIESAWRQALQKVPSMDCVVNNAGMQRIHDFSTGAPALSFANAEIDTNLRGAIMIIAATLPHLKQQSSGSYLINISSGLAFVPMARMPVYCATKAALRSFTLSLRHQLAKSPVRVVDISPPAVSTELHDYMGPQGKSIGMSVDAFTSATMAGLDGGDLDFAVAGAQAFKSVIAENFSQVFDQLNTAADLSR